MILALIGTVGILLIDFFGHRASIDTIMNGTDINIINGSEHCMLFNVNFSLPSPIPYKATTFLPIVFVVSLGEFFIFVPSKT